MQTVCLSDRKLILCNRLEVIANFRTAYLSKVLVSPYTAFL